MKKIICVIFVSVILSSSPVIDGVLSEGEGWVPIGWNSELQTTTIGADLDSLYITFSNDTLFLALTTQNQGSWDVSYGVAFDLDYNPDSGFGRKDWGDVWGRHIAFGMDIDLTLRIEYEVYLWWDGASGAITSWYKYKWLNGTETWEDIGFPIEDRAYTGDNINGLQVLEMAFPYPEPGQPPESIRVAVFITGGDNSSAVDVLPMNPSIIFPATNEEWTDEDTIGTAYTIEFTGIFENHKRPTIYYNNGKIYLNSEVNTEIEIFNLAGIKVFEKRNISGDAEIPVDLRSGFYFLMIKGGNFREFMKVLVTR